MAKQTGKAPADLRGPELPGAAVYLWNWFLDLNAGRGGTGFGPSPLSFTEINSWASLNGLRLSRFELDCIKALDLLYLTQAAEKS